jgi:hypothetical protein
MYNIEVDNETFAISAWDLDNPNEAGKPFMFQPCYPDKTPFESKEKALEWASALEAFLTIPGSPRPSDGPTVVVPTYSGEVAEETPAES